MSTSQPGYFSAYENFALERSPSGVLTVRFHTDGGPVVFTGTTHHDFSRLIEEIAYDRDNSVVVLTGTGDRFMTEIDGPSLGDLTKPMSADVTYVEGRPRRPAPRRVLGPRDPRAWRGDQTAHQPRARRDVRTARDRHAGLRPRTRPRRSRTGDTGSRDIQWTREDRRRHRRHPDTRTHPRLDRLKLIHDLDFDGPRALGHEPPIAAVSPAEAADGQAARTPSQRRRHARPTYPGGTPRSPAVRAGRVRALG
jgi:hypothetical protein